MKMNMNTILQVELKEPLSLCAQTTSLRKRGCAAVSKGRRSRGWPALLVARNCETGAWLAMYRQRVRLQTAGNAEREVKQRQAVKASAIAFICVSGPAVSA